MQKTFVMSWSGGKDSALAYYRAVLEGHVPVTLLTMFEEDGSKSRSHGLPLEIMEAQAERMGLPLEIGKADWKDYEKEFISLLKNFKSEGIDMGVYGDIDLEDHRAWVQKVSKEADIEVSHPLWGEPRRKLLKELIAEGFKAVITVVDTARMDPKFLGREFTMELIEELEAIGIDACGEEGEFHTVILDGPIFVEAVPAVFGQVIEAGQYRVLEVKLQ
ncbi:diphthine--ammonia ligase [Planococcus halotolerans]|uniref:Diphthine--ammonia ligase n=1 Tax=Planococcus halotolerans TaxID=2233542 RepID=A0A365KR77_9BACL|nr:diphthine--ammonia ligase [Planococcus halotolerans]QHJ69357.1 diphthine--ammonia ligase [Planococcus halotolerans]RAZ75661.1 diphthine--ammonia ligase [Planococcus halotolerans]